MHTARDDNGATCGTPDSLGAVALHDVSIPVHPGMIIYRNNPGVEVVADSGDEAVAAAAVEAEDILEQRAETIPQRLAQL